MNSTGVGVAVSGASTGADNAGHDFPPESDIEVLVKKRALRCVATTCDPGGRPGPCTLTDETIDSNDL